MYVFSIFLFCFSLVFSSNIYAYELKANEMRAHFIDMGQADSTLLEFKCGAVLIDAGAQYKDTTSSSAVAENKKQIKKLTDYLDEFFITRPELNNTLWG